MGSELFACPICSKSFVTRGKYNQHTRTHTKPLECDECHTGFALRTDLNRHVKAKHRRGNEKFRCTIAGCGFKATRKDNVAQHLRKFHKVATCDKSKSTPKRANDPQSAELEQRVYPSFMLAASTGRVDVMMHALRHGFDINTRADDGFTALHCAARAGQTATLKFLLQCGANVNAYSDNPSLHLRHLPIHEAVLGKSAECFKILLDEGSILLYEDGSYNTIVDAIVASGHLGMMQDFLEHKEIAPGYDDKNVKVQMLLSEAASSGQMSVLEALIQSEPNAARSFGRTITLPLSRATEKGQLLAVNALIELYDSPHGLYYIAMSLTTAIKRGYTDIAATLCQSKQFRSFATREMIQEATDDAARMDRIDILRLILDTVPRKPDLSKTLLAAAWHGKADIVEFLISDYNVAVNTKDPSGNTALHIAVRRNHVAVADVLLKAAPCLIADADIAYPTPLNMAIGSVGVGLDMIRKLLDYYPTGFSPWRVAGKILAQALKHPGETAERKHQIAWTVLSHPNAEVDAIDHFGVTALRHAIDSCNWAFALHLMQHKAVEASNPPLPHRYPTPWQLSKGFWWQLKYEIARTLLKHEVTPPPPAFDGSDLAQITQILLERKLLSRFFVDDEGTLLHLAVKENDLDLLRVVLSGSLTTSAADLEIAWVHKKDRDGKTAWDLAEEQQRIQMMDLLNHAYVRQPGMEIRRQAPPETCSKSRVVNKPVDWFGLLN